MNLLAHSADGTQAIVQLENELPYFYTFGDIDTYQLIDNPATHMVPDSWVTDYELEGNKGLTISEIKDYIKGYVNGG